MNEISRCSQLLKLTGLVNWTHGVHSELAWLGRCLAEDFSGMAPAVLRLCCDPDDQRPLYLSHVDIALACFPIRLSESDEDRLRRAYVYIVAVYYILDSIEDGHSCHQSELDASSLASLVPLLLLQAVGNLDTIAATYGYLPQGIHTTLIRYFREFRDATAYEKAQRSEPFVSWAVEQAHLSGRSNCGLFLLEYTAGLVGINIPPADRQAVYQLLAAIQRGDDCCDWREDLAARNATPFLRRHCGTQEGLAQFAMSQVEERMYFGGAITEELEQLASEFDDLAVVFQRSGHLRPVAELCAGQAARARLKMSELGHVWRKFESAT